DIIRPEPAPALAAGRAHRGILDRGLQLAVLAGLALTAASWLGTLLWPFELITHFRFQFVAAGSALILVAAVRRRPLAAGAALVIAVANGWPLMPYVLPGALDAQAARTEARLMLANVQFSNDDYPAALALIARENPDVIGL